MARRKKVKVRTTKERAADGDSFKVAPDDMPMIQTGVPRSQICARHNTMKLAGQCVKCRWEANPQRTCENPPMGPTRSQVKQPGDAEEVTGGRTQRVDTGEEMTIGVDGGN